MSIEAVYRRRAKLYEATLVMLRNTFALLANGIPAKGRYANIGKACAETVREIDNTLVAALKPGARATDALTDEQRDALAWAEGRRLDARGKTDPEPHAKTLAATVRQLLGE